MYDKLRKIYRPGSEVKFCGGMKGRILRAEITHKESSYEIVYYDDSRRKEWISEIEIESGKKEKIGYK